VRFAVSGVAVAAVAQAVEAVGAVGRKEGARRCVVASYIVHFNL